MNADLSLLNELENRIIYDLDRLGVFYRCFPRLKTPQSLSKKIDNNPGKYSQNGKKIQDFFGIRLTLYFDDDSYILQNILQNKYDVDGTSIDDLDGNTFGPTRKNVIYRLPNDLLVRGSTLTQNPILDETFEVQFRTVYSEGWHEVEHDLRYKRKEDWKNYKDMDRCLNSIVASLENCDWMMLKIFEELSWRHYKAKNWEPMLRTKFRLRIENNPIDEKIKKILDGDQSFTKELFRINRKAFLKTLHKCNENFPLTINFIIFVANWYFLKNEDINTIIPLPYKSIFNNENKLNN